MINPSLLTKFEAKGRKFRLYPRIKHHRFMDDSKPSRRRMIKFALASRDLLNLAPLFKVV